MKTKHLRVTMPDGSRWDVPAEIIAKSRAAYYAKADTGEDNGPSFETHFKKEMEYTLKNDDELCDWAGNNMNWADVSAHARRVEDPPQEVDWEEGWTNGEMEVVELP